MKTTLIFIVFTMCFFSLSCSKDDEINSREFVTTCYKFIEKGSNVPIVGIDLHLRTSGPQWQGKTNNEGVFCVDHWNDRYSASVFQNVLHQYYYNIPLSLPLNGSSNVVELIPRSNIRIHIINVEPSSIDDQIAVMVQGQSDESINYLDNTSFYGKEIDTFHIFKGIKGRNTISWRVYSSGVLESSHTDEIIIEEYHETIDYEIEY